MRRRATAVVLLATAAALLVLAAPAYAQADKDCGNFATQDEAQAYFKANGGSASNNVDRLDADSDGVACENLPGRSSGGSDQPSGSDTPADRGQRLADTGPSGLPLTTGAGLLATGLLLVVATRYRGRHAR